MKKNTVIPQKSFHVRKNDKVRVISGAHRGKEGKVLQVLRKRNRVIVEGVNLIKKHVKATQANPRGGIEEREGSIHISNVKLVERSSAEAKRSAKE